LKIHFKTIKLKNNILPICLLIFTFCIAIFSTENLIASKNAIILWETTLVPSLLPFFIATELLSNTNIFSYIGRFLDKIMQPLFKVPGIGSFPFILGIISGYPVGAKIVSDLRFKNELSKIEAERLLAFTNNSGPLFIISAVGISMFGDIKIGILLLIIHLLASFSVGFLFRYYKSNENSKSINKKYNNKSIPSSKLKLNNLGEVLRNSIINSINNVLIIGGFILVASILLSILENMNLLNIFNDILKFIFEFFRIPSNLSKSITYGIIEITNGLNILSSTIINNYTIKIIFASFLLGFGGLTILLQVLSFTSKTDISIKPYFYGKILHGSIASIYTYIFLKYTNYFNPTVEVFNSTIYSLVKEDSTTSFNFPSFNWLIYVVLFIIILLALSFLLKTSATSSKITTRSTGNHSYTNNKVKIRIK